MGRENKINKFSYDPDPDGIKWLRKGVAVNKSTLIIHCISIHHPSLNICNIFFLLLYFSFIKNSIEIGGTLYSIVIFIMLGSILVCLCNPIRMHSARLWITSVAFWVLSILYYPLKRSIYLFFLWGRDHSKYSFGCCIASGLTHHPILLQLNFCYFSQFLRVLI